MNLSDQSKAGSERKPRLLEDGLATPVIVRRRVKGKRSNFKKRRRSNFSAITQLHHLSTHDRTVCRSWWPSNHLSHREGKGWNWSTAGIEFTSIVWEEIDVAVSLWITAPVLIAWVDNQYLVSLSLMTDSCFADEMPIFSLNGDHYPHYLRRIVSIFPFRTSKHSSGTLLCKPGEWVKHF